MSNLTQDLLKELFHYDPETGVIVNRISRSGASRGAVAGFGNTKDKYLRVSVNGKIYQLHHIIHAYMTGRLPRIEMDHINGCPDDNRWCNLREATKAENAQNRKMRSDNKSGFNGVGWKKRASKWVARITVNGVVVYLGQFVDLDDAIAARKMANKKYGFHENHGRVV